MKNNDYNRPMINIGKRFIFFVDDEGYASVIANIRRAEKCLYAEDIDTYYSKEGWTMLLLHYIAALQLLIDLYPDSVDYIDIIEYNNLVYIKANKTVDCVKGRPVHILPLQSDAEILNYTIIAADYIATILRHKYKYEYDIIDRLVAYSLRVSEEATTTKNNSKKLFNR